MFQTWDNSQLLRRVLWISAELTIVSSLKHKITQPLYIFNRVRVLHLDRLKKGTWLHSFGELHSHVSPVLFPTASKDFLFTTSTNALLIFKEIHIFFTLNSFCLQITIRYSLISMRLIYYFDTWAITWHDIVLVFLKICTDLQEICSIWAQNYFCYCFWTILGLQLAKLFRNNNKNNFALICCKFLANLQKSWNNMMSNYGLIIENMDLSHIYSFSCMSL